MVISGSSSGQQLCIPIVETLLLILAGTAWRLQTLAHGKATFLEQYTNDLSPGAFTPSCSAYHLPPYVQKFQELKSKGVDIVAFIANNDEFVLNGWGKINHVPKGEDFLMLSDSKTFFSENYGWQAGPNKGDRTGRWAMIVEKDGSISYAENEAKLQDVEVSSVETVLSKL